ncbi:uncharacterized protein LOC143239567 isoform X2 [Tachypleus tridentatus]|uniref:uncharacterized protein LOC143239567 isoform X2 n=1 Tax=Tachypleus tridentatus TaxID=6853 RepID=UPI003FD5EE5D
MVWLCVTVFLIPLLKVSHLTLLPPCLSTSKNITLENVGEDFYNTRSCSDHGGKVHEPLSHSTGGVQLCSGYLQCDTFTINIVVDYSKRLVQGY